MEALKLKGRIDTNGQLHIQEAIDLPAGEVELVVWQLPQSKPDPNPPSSPPSSPPQKRAKTSVKALEGWFEQTEPAPEDFDVDEVRWEALKEKYDL